SARRISSLSAGCTGTTSTAAPASPATTTAHNGRLAKKNRTMKRLLLATAAVLAFAGSALAASDETRLLYFKQGSGPSDCQLQVNNKPTPCDIALLMIYGNNRTRVQFNNDDSGRMVVFEGKFAGQDTNTFIIDGVTVATVEGQPNKVRRSKAA